MGAGGRQQVAVAAAAKRPARGWRCPLEFHYAPVDFLASVPDSHAAGGGTWGTWSRCCWRTIDAVVLPFLPSSFPRVLVKPPLSPPIHRLQPITSFTPLPPRHLSPLILVAARLFVLACRTTSLRFSGLGSIGRCVWLRIGPTSARRSLLLRLSRTSDRDTLRGSTLG